MARHDVPDRRDRLEYAGLASVLAALRTGSWEWGSRGGTALGRFIARAVPLRRDVALENLRLALPDIDASGRRKVYRDMCENYGLLMASFARFGKQTPEDLGQFISLKCRPVQNPQGSCVLSFRRPKPTCWNSAISI